MTVGEQITAKLKEQIEDYDTATLKELALDLSNELNEFKTEEQLITELNNMNEAEREET